MRANLCDVAAREHASVLTSHGILSLTHLFDSVRRDAHELVECAERIVQLHTTSQAPSLRSWPSAVDTALSVTRTRHRVASTASCLADSTSMSATTDAPPRAAATETVAAAANSSLSSSHAETKATGEQPCSVFAERELSSSFTAAEDTTAEGAGSVERCGSAIINEDEMGELAPLPSMRLLFSALDRLCAYSAKTATSAGAFNASPSRSSSPVFLSDVVLDEVVVLARLVTWYCLATTAKQNTNNNIRANSVESAGNARRGTLSSAWSRASTPVGDARNNSTTATGTTPPIQRVTCVQNDETASVRQQQQQQQQQNRSTEDTPMQAWLQTRMTPRNNNTTAMSSVSSSSSLTTTPAGETQFTDEQLAQQLLRPTVHCVARFSTLVASSPHRHGATSLLATSDNPCENSTHHSSHYRNNSKTSDTNNNNNNNNNNMTSMNSKETDVLSASSLVDESALTARLARVRGSVLIMFVSVLHRLANTTAAPHAALFMATLFPTAVDARLPPERARHPLLTPLLWDDADLNRAAAAAATVTLLQQLHGILSYAEEAQRRRSSFASMATQGGEILSNMHDTLFWVLQQHHSLPQQSTVLQSPPPPPPQQQSSHRQHSTQQSKQHRISKHSLQQPVPYEEAVRSSCRDSCCAGSVRSQQQPPQQESGLRLRMSAAQALAVLATTVDVTPYARCPHCRVVILSVLRLSSLRRYVVAAPQHRAAMGLLMQVFNKDALHEGIAALFEPSASEQPARWDTETMDREDTPHTHGNSHDASYYNKNNSNTRHPKSSHAKHESSAHTDGNNTSEHHHLNRNSHAVHAFDFTKAAQTRSATQSHFALLLEDMLTYAVERVGMWRCLVQLARLYPVVIRAHFGTLVSASERVLRGYREYRGGGGGRVSRAGRDAPEQDGAWSEISWSSYNASMIDDTTSEGGSAATTPRTPTRHDTRAVHDTNSPCATRLVSAETVAECLRGWLHFMGYVWRAFDDNAIDRAFQPEAQAHRASVAEKRIIYQRLLLPAMSLSSRCASATRVDCTECDDGSVAPPTDAHADYCVGTADPTADCDNSKDGAESSATDSKDDNGSRYDDETSQQGAAHAKERTDCTMDSGDDSCMVEPIALVVLRCLAQIGDDFVADAGMPSCGCAMVRYCRIAATAPSTRVRAEALTTMGTWLWLYPTLQRAYAQALMHTAVRALTRDSDALVRGKAAFALSNLTSRLSEVSLSGVRGCAEEMQMLCDVAMYAATASASPQPCRHANYSAIGSGNSYRNYTCANNGSSSTTTCHNSRKTSSDDAGVGVVQSHGIRMMSFLLCCLQFDELIADLSEHSEVVAEGFLRVLLAYMQPGGNGSSPKQRWNAACALGMALSHAEVYESEPRLTVEAILALSEAVVQDAIFKVRIQAAGALGRVAPLCLSHGCGEAKEDLTPTVVRSLCAALASARAVDNVHQFRDQGALREAVRTALRVMITTAQPSSELERVFADNRTVLKEADLL